MSDRKIKVQREVSERPINVERESTLAVNATGIFPSGTINITKNGEHDVTTFKTASVAVPNDISQAFTVPEKTGRLGQTVKELILDLGDTVETFQFYQRDNAPNLERVKVIRPGALTTLSNMFRNCPKLTVVDISSLAPLSRLETYNLFYTTTNLRAVIINSRSVLDVSDGTNQFSTSGFTAGVCFAYVPDDLVETYKTGQYGWPSSYIKPLSELPEEYRS